jgi:alpha/beta superfamily hydrolase
MPRRIESHWVPGPAGRLEALLEEPEDVAPLLTAVLCHPHPQYGGTMHNKVVYRLARGLRAAGAAVLRFNFRGVGASHGEYGAMAGEIEDARAALAWLRDRYRELPFALAGFSFGGRAISELACEIGSAQFLLAAGFPTRLGSTDYLETCAVPKIFIQSTHDEFSPRSDFERVYQRFAEPKRVVWIEAADHFFAGALPEVEAAAAEAASS